MQGKLMKEEGEVIGVGDYAGEIDERGRRSDKGM